MVVVVIVFINFFFVEDYFWDVFFKYICVFVYEIKGCFVERIDYYCCLKLKGNLS